ncbi:hypothetical protein TNCV_1356201 [Trichonephila clavipes]|uniref:Uncharacterized protein n=1 Tax=Trichonephila clavipes TaxID=2585209 RepID=A0A8X6SJM8_TRICX|nr:hypothetical protein TNCV_1356201 [Trichonephila clavipes]
MGYPHTNTIVLTTEIESEFLAKDNLVSFRCSPAKRRRRWVGVKGSTRNGRRDPKFPSSAFVWFEKTQGVLMKVLPVPGWRRMK